MEKEFVSKEFARELECLGFNQPCLAFYGFGVDDCLHINGITKVDCHPRLDVPLFQQAFRWFRDVHNLHPLRTGNEFYTSYSLGMKHLSFERAEKNKNHSEEAQLECLRKLIEIVKNKQL